MKAVAARMRADSARVILPGEPQPLARYLTKRAAEGFRINLNHLGEVVLGEEEAARRLAAVPGHLADPAVKYISVKISAVFSQINLVAWDETLAAIKVRLRTLYRAAVQGGKFVNLAMEEYRDLALTVAAFRRVLDEPMFRAFSAGIVLQAYLPDSGAAQRELTEWARRHVAAGGAPIKIRLVKGANLAMEAVEAELHGWHPAPDGSKAETDANFRRLLVYGVSARTEASQENDYRAAGANHFAIEHDPSALRCESNVFRHRPCRGVVLRLEFRDQNTIGRAQHAAQITGAPVTISAREEESDAEFIARLPELAKGAEFLRTISTPGDVVLRAAQAAGLNWINAPLLACGRIELTRWLREQAVSETRHRYGQLPAFKPSR